MHQTDQCGHLDERADDARQRLARGDAEQADGDGDGQFEVVAGGSEGYCGGRRVAGTERAGGQEGADKVA